MKTDTKLLKEYIQAILSEMEIFDEIARTSSDAEEENLALSIWKTGLQVFIVLFRTRSFLNFCEEIISQPNNLNLDSKIDAVLYLNNNPVVGFIKMQKDECGWNIKNSAANKGYGPLMYDIALSYAGKTGVVPDRVEGVTPSARKIWKHYKTQRKNDISVRPFPEDHDCASYNNDEDSWFLDVNYVLKNSQMNNMKNLISKGDEIANSIREMSKNELNPYEILRRLASFFFEQKYMPESLNLDEVAKTARDAEGYAMTTYSQGNKAYLVLYQPDAFKTIWFNALKQPKHLRFDHRVEMASKKSGTNPIIGFIKLERTKCGWVVKNSIAAKGYGPFMYDIALSYAGKDGVVPDRETVSQAARNIWRYYATERANEVRIYPFSNSDPCKVHNEDEDSWFLDAKYILRTSKINEADGLLTKHQEVKKQIEDVVLGDDSIEYNLTLTIPEATEEALRILGAAYFTDLTN